MRESGERAWCQKSYTDLLLACRHAVAHDLFDLRPFVDNVQPLLVPALHRLGGHIFAELAGVRAALLVCAGAHVADNRLALGLQRLDLGFGRVE